MRAITIILILLSFSTHGSITEGGRGMLFGDDHSFTVTAKKEWVLDNQSGRDQGLHMIFYPLGESWSNSPVIIYGRSVSVSEVTNVKSQVVQTVNDFHSNGSPGYESKVQEALELTNGNKAALYHFSGDQWGNYEAAAYIKEADTINYLVFNSRTKANFERYIGDFYQIVKSYKNIYIAPKTYSSKKLAQLKSESTSILTRAGAKEYEANAIKAVGQTISNVLQACTSYLKDKQLPSFRYFVRIGNDGNINTSHIFPTNALSVCFKGLMMNEKYPAHAFESFLLNIDMKISP